MLYHAGSRLLLLVTASVLVFVFNLASFWPGLVSNDSVTTYEIAVSGNYDDWSPLLMSLFWGLVPTSPPGWGMLAVHSALFAGGWLLWALSLLRRTGRLSVLAFAAYFFPAVMIYGGLMWRDVLLAGFFLCSTGALALHESRRSDARESGTFDHALIGLAIVAGVLGGMTRTNGFFAFLPIAFYCAMLLQRRWLGVAVAFCILFALPPVINTALFKITDAKKTYVENSLLVFDLGALSQGGENFFPGKWTEAEATAIRDTCHVGRAWDTYMWGDCKFVSERLMREGNWSASLKPVWLHAIMAHPFSYAKHRVIYYATLMAPPWQPLLVSVPNTAGFDYQPGVVANVLYWLSAQSRLSPLKFLLFTPLAWFAYGALALWAQRKWVGSSHRAMTVTLLSALFYALAYGLVGVANDYRYVYWPIMAATTCVCVVTADLLAMRRSTTDAKILSRI
jgi:hypothetical protein